MPGDDHTGIPSGERSGALGPPDVATMGRIRDLFVQEEPLVEHAQFDSAIDPTEVRIQFADGIGDASWCRLDCTWYKTKAYRFHYVDNCEINWRFDRHPNPHSSETHFHQPPDAPVHEATKSAIAVQEPLLVARAVLKLWRRAYDDGNHDRLNTATNPP